MRPLLLKTGMLPALALAALHLACSPILPVSEPPLYHRLAYETEAVECNGSFPDGVRVWRFSEASPFDRSEMAVLEPGGEVVFSSAHRWVSTPGVLVAEALIRDLVRDRTFPRVVSGNDPAAVAYEITGRVYEFGWRKGEGSGRAVLEAEVRLVRKQGTPEVLTRRLHEVVSEPLDGNAAGSFTSAMSEAMRRFSRQVRRDLCDAAEK